MQDGVRLLMSDLGMEIPKKIPEDFAPLIQSILDHLELSEKNLKIKLFKECYFTNASIDDISKRCLVAPKYIKKIKKEICGHIKKSEQFIKYNSVKQEKNNIKGYTLGFNDGYSSGHQDAYSDGYETGLKEGYDAGYADGLQAASQCNFDLEKIISENIFFNNYYEDEIEIPSAPIEEAGFSARLYNTLQNAGYSDIKEIITAGPEKIKSIHGLGRKSYTELVDALVIKYDQDPGNWQL